MGKFKVDNSKLDFIADQFSVEKETVRLVNGLFQKVSAGIKIQYLAHIIRSMENYIRVETENPMFQINCFPLDPASPILNVGCAQYFPKRYFTIFFHPNMDEKQLRVCLAHELGHLFLIELINDHRKAGDRELTDKEKTEPLSSIFGVLTIMDKNDFYETCGELLNHDTWEAIVQSFVLLKNRQ